MTVTEFSSDKATRLKIIEIATVNSYRDATWAINKLPSAGFKQTGTAESSVQKICTGVSDSISF